MANIKVSYNGTEFTIKLDGFDSRTKETKQMIEQVKAYLEFAASKLTLNAKYTISLRNNEFFFTTAKDKGLRKVWGTFDGKKTIEIATKAQYPLYRTIFHELGHAEHESKFPGSTKTWSVAKCEEYAEHIEATLAQGWA